MSILYVIRLIRIFDQTAFVGEILGGIVDARLGRA